MSSQGIMSEDFANQIALITRLYPSLDGLNIANVLQRAATEAMKECLSGEEGDGRDQACFEMLDQARQQLTDEMPRARERMRQWRASISSDWLR
jgi:hypothetical protein